MNVMKNLASYTPLYLSLFLILGIYIEYSYKLVNEQTLWIAMPIVGLLFLFRIHANRLYRYSLVFTVLSYMSVIGIGIFSTYLSDPRNNPKHYSRSDIFFNNDLFISKLQIQEVLRPTKSFYRYVAFVRVVDAEQVRGKILLNIKKEILFQDLNVDDVLLSRQQFQEIRSPQIPYEFNYKKYLENQNIYHQIYIMNADDFKIQTPVSSTLGNASRFRNRISLSLKKMNVSEEVLAVIQALWMGQKTGLSRALRTSYANAGAMHILAVSGLHVGIFTFLLFYILRPLQRFKFGKVAQLLISLFFLWSFALIAGLSASVVRAVTMFTAVSIALLINRPFSVHNSLFFSLFVLLLIHPYFLFDVGFQLSYLAVIGIIWLRPAVKNIWHPKSGFLKKIWALTTVSMAAQLGVFPLTVYYFKQFPGLFFLSNLVLIPFLGSLLIAGVFVLFMAYFNILYTEVANVFFYCIDALNSIVKWIGSMGFFVIDDLTITDFHILLFYSLLIVLFMWMQSRNIQFIFWMLVIVIAFQLDQLFFVKRIMSSSELLIFNDYNKSMVLYRKGDRITVFSERASIQEENRSLANYRSKFDIPLENLQWNNSYLVQTKTRRILRVDSLGLYKYKSVKPDIVILQNSPKINLSRLILELKPDLIVADGTNFSSYINKWEATCVKTKTPFHSTNRKGAFILKEKVLIR